VEGGGVVVFAGGRRPVDFAALDRPIRDAKGRVTQVGGASSGPWELRLTLAMHGRGVFISNFREILPPRPSGYTVRLLVGADDGAARRFDVDVNWDGDAADPAAALESVQLAVREM